MNMTMKIIRHRFFPAMPLFILQIILLIAISPLNDAFQELFTGFGEDLPSWIKILSFFIGTFPWLQIVCTIVFLFFFRNRTKVIKYFSITMMALNALLIIAILLVATNYQSCPYDHEVVYQYAGTLLI